MKFYVVESNKEKVNVRSSKCYSNESLIIAFAQFQLLSKKKNKRYIYLIADFEDRSDNIFHRIKMEDNENEMLPFFIICQFDCLYDVDILQSARKDNVRIIDNNGFIQEFRDNFAAMKAYIDKKSNNDPKNGLEFEFCINYTDPEDPNRNIYSRTIDCTSRYLLFEYEYHIIRFKFDLNKINKWETV